MGKYKGIVTDIVEYESAALMGANLDIADIRAVAHLVKLCDRFGMDSMSTGSVIGFAMEAFEKGLLDQFPLPEGIALNFGNVGGAEYLIHAMAFQQDALGRLMSKGVKKAAKALGGGSTGFCHAHQRVRDTGMVSERGIWYGAGLHDNGSGRMPSTGVSHQL